MLGISTIIRNIFPKFQIRSVSDGDPGQQQHTLQALGLNDFLSLDIPPREMLLELARVSRTGLKSTKAHGFELHGA